MDELLGGLKYPHCGYNFEPGDMGKDYYACTGCLNGEYNYFEMYGYSLEEVVAKAELWGYTDVRCVPSEYYNTSPGF